MNSVLCTEPTVHWGREIDLHYFILCVLCWPKTLNTLYLIFTCLNSSLTLYISVSPIIYEVVFNRLHTSP